MLKLAFIWLGLLLIPIVEYAQCTNGLGIPLITETFGAGTFRYGPPLNAFNTDYTYLTNECPDNGQYTIVNYTSGCYDGAWPTLTDHTGDPGGYFMIINAAAQPGIFYTQTVSGLCPGTTYNFSAWMVDLSGPDLASVTYLIETTDGTVLGSYDTGQIPVNNPAQWLKYSFYFTTPTGVSTVVLRMRTDAANFEGGDNFAVDDISFGPAGPQTQISISGSARDTIAIPCNNTTRLLSAVDSCYTQNAYQWQLSTDDMNWTDISGATSSTYSLGSAPVGTFFYRLGVADAGNIGSVNCRALSNVVMVTNAKYVVPRLQTLSASICSGYYTLPSGRQVSTAGVYTDTLLSKSGCDSLITTATLNVAEQPDLGKDRSICFGDTAVLYPGFFNSYKWQDGSIEPGYIATKAGTYTVTVTDSAGCQLADTIQIRERFCSVPTIPNTFTPNGDGINDTWNIPQLQYFPACTVFVYNRWGRLIFNSTGYARPWDGAYNGKPLPAGTYYYIITLQPNGPVLSGFVALLR